MKYNKKYVKDMLVSFAVLLLILTSLAIAQDIPFHRAIFIAILAIPVVVLIGFVFFSPLIIIDWWKKQSRRKK